MTEYIYGAAPALAKIDAEAEAAELPDPADFKPGTTIRTSGGRTGHRVERQPTKSRWRGVTLIPRDELIYRRARLLATACKTTSTLPETPRSRAEILAGGVIDSYEGLPRQLLLPRATTPGAVVRIDGTTWRRWGTTWTPARRLVTTQQERRQRALDALPIIAGIMFAAVGVHDSDLGAAARNALLLISETCLFLGVLATGAARHRAQTPAREQGDPS